MLIGDKNWWLWIESNCLYLINVVIERECPENRSNKEMKVSVKKFIEIRAVPALTSMEQYIADMYDKKKNIWRDAIVSKKSQKWKRLEVTGVEPGL